MKGGEIDLHQQNLPSGSKHTPLTSVGLELHLLIVFLTPQCGLCFQTMHPF